MKINHVHSLVVPLFALAVAGCHTDPEPPDMGGPADLYSAIDMQSPIRDLSGMPGDMRLPPGDMPPPVGDMPPPPGDMPPPSGDMSTPAGDMSTPTVDMSTPTGDMPLPSGDMTSTPDLPIPPADMSGVDMTPPPPPAEFITLRVGDGSAALDATAAAGFLERHKISDGSLVGSPIALPTTATGTNHRLTFGGFTSSEGSLNLSGDGHYAFFGGYDAAVGTANVSTSSAATVNRVIGRLDAAGNVDTSTAANFFTTASVRSVVSTDGNAVWATGSVGIIYTTFGSTATPKTLLAGNFRWIQLLFGQLYASSGSTVYHGINQIGVGTPMAFTTATLLSGFIAQPMTSHYGFFGLDRDGTPGMDVLYVADDRDVASGGGIQRWTLSGTTWKLDGTIKLGLTAGTRGVTGFVSGANVVLLATTAEVPARLVSFVDDGTALDMLPSKALATAATNTVYRGISLPPQ